MEDGEGRSSLVQKVDLGIYFRLAWYMHEKADEYGEGLLSEEIGLEIRCRLDGIIHVSPMVYLVAGSNDGWERGARRGGSCLLRESNLGLFSTLSDVPRVSLPVVCIFTSFECKRGGMLGGGRGGQENVFVNCIL